MDQKICNNNINNINIFWGIVKIRVKNFRPVITCSKLTIEIVEQDVKYVVQG